jgi:YVTN family beta-propeller protein
VIHVSRNGPRPHQLVFNIAATTPVGHLPKGVTVTPDGSKVYVTNRGRDSVSVIDTATNTVTAAIAVGQSPEGVAVTPDGSKVYVANRTARARVSRRWTDSLMVAMVRPQPWRSPIPRHWRMPFWRFAAKVGGWHSKPRSRPRLGPSSIPTFPLPHCV